MHTKLTTIGCFGITLLAAADRSAVAQHVHGLVELGIVLEDSTLAVSVRAPLSDIVGFEHAPENDEQAARLTEAGELLSDADAMFGTPEAAGCVADPITMDAPEYLHAFLYLPDSEETHDHDDHEDHAEEAHDHDHDSEAHAESSDHADHDHDHGP